MCFGRIKMGRNSGFTLIELSIALIIFLLMTLSMIATLKLSVDRMLVYMDERKAFNRTSRVIALMKAPVFYCGFGMPVGSDDYKKAFGGQRFDPFRWNGPITTRTGSSNLPNSEMRIAYAQPGSTKIAAESLNFSSPGNIVLNQKPLDSELADSFAGNSNDTKNWILFPNMMPPSLPLCITGIDDKTLNVVNNMNLQFNIPQGDRLFLYRAMSVYCLSDCVYTRDYRAAGDQPRIVGIQDLRFDVDITNRLVTIYILARGDSVFDSPKPIINIISWPTEYIQPWINKPSKYQLYASKIVWGLPNCVQENVTKGKGITERF